MANITSFKKNENLTYSSGHRYSHLLLTGKGYNDLYGGSIRKFVECICDCGNVVYKSYQSIRQKLIKSCGCQRRFLIGKGSIKHGKHKHPLYSIWTAVKMRCHDPNTIGYSNYGLRGIIVCEEWLNSFEKFYNWAITHGWCPGLSIDRINVNGNYEPSNCRWATTKEQSRNKRNTTFITAFGETKCFKDWSIDERCKVSYGALWNRIFHIKMNPEEAMTKIAFSIGRSKK